MSKELVIPYKVIRSTGNSTGEIPKKVTVFITMNNGTEKPTAEILTVRGNQENKLTSGELEKVKGFDSGDGKHGHYYKELKMLVKLSETNEPINLSLIRLAYEGLRRLIVMPGYWINTGEFILKPRLNLIQFIALQIYGRSLLSKMHNSGLCPP